MNSKIWIFNHYATNTFFDKGGRHYCFAKYLNKCGHDAKIFCASTVHNADKNLITNNNLFFEDLCDDIPYIFIRTRNYKGNGKQRIFNMVDYFFRLFKVIKEIEKKYEKPDIIYASSVHPLACVAGILIARRYKIKCICEIRDLWPLTLVELGKFRENSFVAKLMYRMEHWIYKRADSIIFTTEGGKNYIVDKSWSIDKGGDINLKKVYYINNGIDLVRYNYSKLNDQFIDADLENDRFFRVIYTGSIGKANAVEYIIYAAEILKNRGYKDIKFIIFGDGYDKKELEDYCEKNNVKNVTFKGKVDKKYIPNIISKGCLNIFTSKNIDLYKYGLSLNKMFDYMASGKPTISNIKCGYDILVKYGCGLTVKSGSAEAIAEGIIKFYDMPKDEYDEYCKNSLIGSQEYDFKKLTNKLEQVINDTLDGIHKELD